MLDLSVNLTNSVTTAVLPNEDAKSPSPLTLAITNRSHRRYKPKFGASRWQQLERWLFPALLALLVILGFTPVPVHADEPSFTTRHFIGIASAGIASANTLSIVTGDVNGDGHLDLIVGNMNQPDMVYLNDGFGNFPPPEQDHSFGQASDKTFSVAVGDVNGDGYLDIITGNYGKQNWVYINDGQGNFPKKNARPFGTGNDQTRSVAVGDVNGDGFLDLITGNDGEQNVVYLNDGQGNFPKENGRLFGTGSDKTFSVAVGDVNNDGFLDLIVGNGNTFSVSATSADTDPTDPGNDGGQNFVYLNDGGGNFLLANERPFGTGSDDTRSVKVGDMNGDGYLDIVTGNWRENGMVYLNDGFGNFPQAQRRAFHITGDATLSVEIGDVDGDGSLDILSGNHGQSVIYFNDGVGNFSEAQSRPFGTGSVSTHSVAVGDLDGDGHLDLISGNNGYKSYVNLSDGAGNFSEEKSLSLNRLGDVTLSMAVGDMNGDGHLDLIAGNELAQNVVYMNDGHGNFPLEQRRLFGTNKDKSRSVAVGDLNNDGHLDIIIGNEGTQNWVYLNDGYGNFRLDKQRPFGTGTDQTNSVAVGDMDRDGYLDIVVGNAHEQNMIYLNDGAGNFPQKKGRPFGMRDNGTLGIVVGDVDRDGHLDIITRNSELTGQSIVYFNDGTGNFPQKKGRPFTTGYNYRQGITAGDVNGDGYLDLIVGSWGQNVINLNDGQGNFSNKKLSTFGSGGDRTYSVAVGDVDGDGKLDLTTGNATEKNVVYFNDGLGDFPEVKGMPFTTGARNTIAVAVGDVDGDGVLDLISGNHGAPNAVNLNKMHQTIGLANQGLRLTVTRPVTTANADFLSSPIILNNRVISIPYTLFDGEGDRVGRVAAFYSPDGGGRWLPAVAATNTVTQNLETGRAVVRAHLSPALSISTSANSPLHAPLHITEQITLAEVEVWVAITHTQTGELSIALQSPQGKQVPLVVAGNAQGQNFKDTRFSAWATTSILYGDAPYMGIYRPLGDLSAFKGAMSSGDWTLIITNTGVITGELMAWGLRLTSPPASHTFQWDTFASGFFGQSDNVVVRLVAYPQPLAAAAAITNTNRYTDTYRYTNTVPGPDLWPYVSATTFPFRVRGTQVRVVDEKAQPLTGAIVYRLPSDQFSGATPLANSAEQPFRTDTQGYLQGRGRLQVGDDLVALLPLTPTLPFTFTKQINYFLTSAAPINRGLELTKLSTPGVLTLTVPTSPTRTHPLLLFNLTVSLEWDASDDELFQLGLKEGFQRASELLYKVTNGQAAIGQVDVFPAKSYWNQADLILYASNSLRPSAAIGGVVKAPMSETVFRNGDPNAAKQSMAAAYVPGQVRMGTSWDPFGEETGDLSEQWWRALAHELSHHLFFLPDDYLGFKTAGPNAQRFLGRVDCQHSFMTTTFDPTYTKFLDRSFWLGDCLQTVAAFSTGRSDWETITHFYPMLKAPAEPPTAGANSSLAVPPDGPNLLPLDVTHLVFWSLPAPRPTLSARYFQLRDGTGQAVRLPTARVYLFQTQGTADPTDDVLLALGSPTGGGDRIKVRGGQSGDRLCLFDFGASDGKTYTGCIRQLSAGDVSIPVRALEPERTGARWAPAVDIRALTTRTLVVTVTQALPPNTPLKMQVFPAHYPSAPGLAPVAALTLTHGVYVGQVSLLFPASDVSVRVWVDDGTNLEAVSQFNLQLPWKPNDPVMAGPGSPIVGGPGSPIVGGPGSPIVGGPGSPIVGGPGSPIVGGPGSPIVGGPGSPIVGGPGSPIVGGPGSPIVGGPNQPMVGGAPMRSADAQVVVYNQAGLFEPSGIESLQILPSPSELGDEPWLVPVGQAYFVEPDAKVKTLRRIAVTYLQRDVPDGYEDTLMIYYLPKGAKTWQRLPTTRFVENLVVADLQPGAGTYAVMSTVALPALHPGWNVLTYPLPYTRPVTIALASLANLYSVIYKPDPDKLIQVRESTINAMKYNKLKTNVNVLEFGQVYWIKLEGNQTVTPFLAPPRRAPDGIVGSTR